MEDSETLLRMWYPQWKKSVSEVSNHYQERLKMKLTEVKGSIVKKQRMIIELKSDLQELDQKMKLIDDKSITDVLLKVKASF